jgi:hypothetical protein
MRHCFPFDILKCQAYSLFMPATQTARKACPVCTSTACLGYTCEPMAVSRALGICRASITDREQALNLACKYASNAQGRLDKAIEAGESESILVSLELDAAREWSGVSRLRGYWQSQVASRLRLERMPASGLVDGLDRLVAA